MCFTDEEIRNKASHHFCLLFKVVLFSFSRKRERERERERARERERDGEEKEEEGAEKHISLSLSFLNSAPAKKKDQRQERATCSLASDRNNDQRKQSTSAFPRDEKSERGGKTRWSLHTHNKEHHHHHHGTQTNLETVHLQNDRVRAFIKPSERCSSAAPSSRVEIRELARVVR